MVVSEYLINFLQNGQQIDLGLEKFQIETIKKHDFCAKNNRLNILLNVKKV